MRQLIKKIPGVRALTGLVRRTLEKSNRRRLLGQMRVVKDAGELAVVIIMPGCVHIGALALDYLKGDRTVLCIANGLADWEVEALRGCHFTAMARIQKLLPHAAVIDALVEVLENPFWLVDHDCYVLDAAVLQQERKLLGNRAGVAFYKTTNPVNGIVAPETFLLLLNPEVIRRLQQKFGVTCREYTWDTLPQKAKERLREIGVNQNRRPEEHKAYFDTLRVIALLAQADGSGFAMDRGYSAMCQPYPEVIHVGGTSQPIWPPHDRYYSLGSYFWRRCLEASHMTTMQAEYVKRWPHVPTAKVIRQQLMTSEFLLPGDAPELLDYLEGLATRSLPRTGAHI